MPKLKLPLDPVITNAAYDAVSRDDTPHCSRLRSNSIRAISSTRPCWPSSRGSTSSSAAPSGRREKKKKTEHGKGLQLHLETCQIQDPEVKIGRVIRGNPYVWQDADPSEGLEDSVPPDRSYKLKVTVTPSLEGTGRKIQLKVINGSSDNGYAQVSPDKIDKTTLIKVEGVTQTEADSGGQLHIQASLEDRVLAVSAGFSVCSHPLNPVCKFHASTGNSKLTALSVLVRWETDAANPDEEVWKLSSDDYLEYIEDLDEVEFKELVDLDELDEPPFIDNFENETSDWLPADKKQADDHTCVLSLVKKNGTEGYLTFDQLLLFRCNRCGSKDKVVPNSGFTIKHQVTIVDDHVILQSSKEGADVNVTEEGTEDETSYDASAGRVVDSSNQVVNVILGKQYDLGEVE